MRTTTDGRIRYNFTRDPNQPYQGDIAVGCYQKNSILVDKVFCSDIWQGIISYYHYKAHFAFGCR